MGPYGIREEKAGGPEQRDKDAGTSPFVLQNPKNQTEHTSSLKGLPKKTYNKTIEQPGTTCNTCISV